MIHANDLFAAYWRSTRPRLPDAYAETEYINSSGSAYFDTGLKASSTDAYAWRAMKVGNTGNQSVVGDGNTKTDSNFALWIAPPGASQTYSVEFSFGDGGNDAYKVWAPHETYDVTQWHLYKADLGTGRAWVDGVLLGTASTVSSFANSKKLVIFGSWRGSATNSTFTGRFSSFTAWRSGVRIMDLVPCRRLSDSEPGFYDLLGSISPNTSTPFFTSSNQSKISAGPDIVF